MICQYLGDQKPQSGLVPKIGTMERYRLMEALSFASSEIHKQIGALFNPKLTAEMKEIQLGVIGRRFDALEKLLEGKQFIAGDKFTVADAYLFHGDQLDQRPQDRSRKVAQHQSVHGPDWCKAEGPRDHEVERVDPIANGHGS